MHSSRTRGFSLVELLVAAFLFGLLALLMVNYLVTSRKSNAQNNIRSDLNQVSNVLGQFVPNSIRRAGYVSSGNAQYKEFQNQDGTIWNANNKTGGVDPSVWRNSYFTATIRPPTNIPATSSNSLKGIFTDLTNSTTPAFKEVAGTTGESKHYFVSWVDHVTKGTADYTFNVYIRNQEIWRDNTSDRKLVVRERMYYYPVSNVDIAETPTQASIWGAAVEVNAALVNSTTALTTVPTPMTLVSHVANFNIYYQYTTGWSNVAPTSATLGNLQTIGIYARTGAPNPSGSCKSYPSSNTTLGLPSGVSNSSIGLPSSTADTGSTCQFTYQERIISVAVPNLASLQ